MNLFSLRRSAGLTFCMLASMHTFFGFLSDEDSLVSGPAKAEDVLPTHVFKIRYPFAQD